jgi:PAS domain S-box-containing protein/putative nucleotidyltransferase with HDIG domain
MIGQVFDNRNLYIALYDEAANYVSFPIYWMDGERRNPTAGRPAGNGLTEFVLRTRKPVLITDHMQEALTERSVSLMGTPSLCYLGVPILIDERGIGVIAVQDYEHEHVYDADHLELLATIAFQAAIAIENARLYEAIQKELTERKRAEEALQKSEARLRAIVQTANDAIVTMDMRGIIVEWNTAAETIFGFSADEAIGMLVSQIVPEQFRTQQHDSIERVRAGDERHIVGKTVEVLGLAKDGREFPVEMSLAEWKTQAGDFFTAIIRDIGERKQRENELQAIATVSAALRTAPTRAEILSVIVEQLSILLNCDSMSAEIIDSITQDTVVEAAQGTWMSAIGFRQSAGTGLNAVISKTRQPYLDNYIQNNPLLGVPDHMIEGILAGAGAPLIAQERLIGFLWMGRRKAITESEVRLFAAVADIAANAIHRATLHEQAQKDAANLARAYDSTLEGWAHALELRDQETEGHTRRVAQMTVELARAMGFDQDELEHVRRGALLHDIGKMGVPDSILLKPGMLTEHEWDIMRRHPVYAHQFLESIEYLRPSLDIPYCHHEKWDGSGYPRGLKHEQIPLVARIFSIVDVWDALLSDRPYRAAWKQEKVMEYIKQHVGSHFDPLVAEAFLRIV